VSTLLAGEIISQNDAKNPREINWLQTTIITETERLTNQLYFGTFFEKVNFDAFQAICFLVVSNDLVGLDDRDIPPCLDLLGAPLAEVWAAAALLSKTYHLPDTRNLADFIIMVSPAMLREGDDWN
jgi:hypothetical protein